MALPSPSPKVKSPSQQMDAIIKKSGDWRGETLSRLRAVILRADPDVVEEVKWKKTSNPMGVPVWSHNGGICTGETYRDVVKLTFFKGASLEDPSHVFTQGGTVRRAIDVREGEKVNEAAIQALIRAAVALNLKGKRSPRSLQARATH